MRKNDKKLFLNKAKLGEMLYLRFTGFSLISLAALYNCDVMSIFHQCNKFHIEPLTEVYAIDRIIRHVLPPPPPPKWKIINGEKINLGRNYKEYLMKTL